MEQNLLPDDVVQVVLRFCEDLDTPVSLGVYLRVKWGDWRGVAELTTAPQSYLNAAAYLKDAQATSLLKKLRQLPSGVDVREAALQKWWEAERQCYQTNERLQRYLPRWSQSADRDAGISDFLSEVRKTIVSWIGLSPPELCSGRFGPGATFSDRGKEISVPHKCSSDPSLTRDAVWYLPQWLGSQLGSALAANHGKFDFVRGNRHTTVPKTALVDRSIAVEPAVNVFFQLGLGTALRRRLKARTGWDLDHAADIHRQVAREASVTREFATLDLSNASDTMATTLVKLLLPSAWFAALSDLRSPLTLVDGRWIRLEKFSSMGNGYTFELETLIFAALSCSVSRRCGYEGVLGVDVFVFGDDIIVKDDIVRPLSAVLQFAGFSLNATKSFSGGIRFRESCGGDFFDGVEVRPYYLKELPSVPLDWFGFANGVSRTISRLAACGSSISRRAWFRVLDALPRRLRDCRGPEALGDIVIHDSISRWSTRREHSIRYILALTSTSNFRVRYDWFSAETVLACATYGAGGGVEGGVIPRDPPLSYKVRWVPYS